MVKLNQRFDMQEITGCETISFEQLDELVLWINKLHGLKGFFKKASNTNNGIEEPVFV